jgi:hypothetical protein
MELRGHRLPCAPPCAFTLRIAPSTHIGPEDCLGQAQLVPGYYLERSLGHFAYVAGRTVHSAETDRSPGGDRMARLAPQSVRSGKTGVL